MYIMGFSFKLCDILTTYPVYANSDLKSDEMKNLTKVMQLQYLLM